MRREQEHGTACREERTHQRHKRRIRDVARRGSGAAPDISARWQMPRQAPMQCLATRPPMPRPMPWLPSCAPSSPTCGRTVTSGESRRSGLPYQQRCVPRHRSLAAPSYRRRRKCRASAAPGAGCGRRGRAGVTWQSRNRHLIRSHHARRPSRRDRNRASDGAALGDGCARRDEGSGTKERRPAPPPHPLPWPSRTNVWRTATSRTPGDKATNMHLHPGYSVA